MSLFSGRKLRIFSSTLLLSVAFLFWLFVSPAQAYHATSSYAKPLNGTLTSSNWNDLFSDFVNTWLPTTMNGPLGIGTTIPPSAGLFVNGPVSALNIYSTSNVGIGKTNPGSSLDIIGSVNSSGTINGTGLCIANDCKVSWPAVGAASSGWTQSGLTLYKTDVNGNVGIGTPTPTQKLTVAGVIESTSGGFKFPDGTVQITAGGGGSSQWVSASSTSIYYNGGRVGIGTTNPASSLDVGGTGITLGGVTRTTWPGGVGSGFGTDMGTYAYYMGGNVGFGTTNPTAKLQVYTSAAYDGISLDGSNSPAFRLMNAGVTKAYIALPSSGTIFSSDAAANDLVIRTENVSQKILFNVNGGGSSMMALNNGNVGIGTTNPTVALHVIGSATLTKDQNNATALNINNDDLGASVRSLLTLTNVSSNFEVGLGGSGRSDGWADNAWIWSSANAPMRFGTFGAERMRIEGGGNIGIAKTNPGTTLDLVGSLSASGTVNGTGLCIAGDCKVSWPAVGAASSGWSQNGNEVYKTNTAGNVGVGTSAPINKLTVYGGGALGDIRTGFSDASSWSIGRDNITTGDFVFVDGTLASTERMRIQHTSGNVGIGTIAPNQKLTVLGNAMIGRLSENRGILIQGAVGATHYSWMVGAQQNVDAALEFTPSTVVGGTTFTTPVMTIKQSGNVGIGTVSPVSKLSISDATTPTLSIYNSVDNNVEGGRIRFLETPSTTFLGGFIHYDGSANVLNIGTHTIGDQLASNDVNTISLSRGTGNVGINKGAPGTTLDIVGSLSASGTVNGTGLCIAGDCKVSWAAVGAASSGWSQNGTNVYKTNTAGNVGIGTTNPATDQLVVRSSVAGAGRQIGVDSPASGYSQFNFLDNGVTKWRFRKDTSNEFDLYSDTLGASVIHAKENGNVGIGTIAPTSKLDIAGSVGGLLSAGTVTNSGGWNTVIGSTGGNGLVLAKMSGNTATSSDRLITLQRDSTDAAGLLSVYDGAGNIKTQFDGNGVSYFMAGNVGIGLTAPSEKLEISAPYYGALKINANTTAAANYVGGIIEIESNIDYRGRGIYLSHRDTTDLTASEWYMGVPYEGNIFQIGNAAQSVSINSAGGPASKPQAKFAITKDGNVGIAKFNPATTLDVVGSISSTGTVNGTGLCIAGDCKVSWAAVGAASSGWSQNGTNVYKTNTAGNVGIGTTNPQFKLNTEGGTIMSGGSHDSITGPLVWTNVGSTNDGVAISYDQTNKKGRISSVDMGTSFSPLYFQGNEFRWSTGVGSITEKMVLNVSGNLGIGTTAPGGKLQIDEYTVGANGTQNVFGTSNIFTNTGTDALYLGIKNHAYPNRGWAFRPVTDGVNSDLQIYEHGSSGARMTIQTGGNVGIGTTSPETSLHIARSSGAYASTGASGSVLYAQTTGASTYPMNAYFNAAGTTDNTVRHRFANNGVNKWQINYSNDISWYYDTPGTGSWSPAVTFQQGGNVGINKSAPATTLDIVGSLSASGTVNGTGLCIAGDCKVSWAAVGAASSGWTQNGNEVYKTNTAGNVGIGVTNPTSKLQISESNKPVGTSNISIKTTDAFSVADAGGKLGLGGTYNSAGANTNYVELKAGKNNSTDGDFGGYFSLYTQTNGSGLAERLRVDSTGNVGIGTTNPGAKLEVAGSVVINNNQAYRAKDTGGTTRNIIGLSGSNHIELGGTGILHTSIINKALIGGNIAPINTLDVEGALAVGSNYSGTATAPVNGAIIEGNVGIGTANPGSDRLRVSTGDQHFRSFASGSGVSDAAISSTFYLSNNGTTAQLIYNKAGGHLNLSTTGGGNIGISKTNPAATLDVVGSINASGTVNGTGLCIAGDCKVSWPAVGAASSGWTQNGVNIYKTDVNGNVGIGITNPSALGRALNLYNGASAGSSIALEGNGGSSFMTLYSSATAGDPSSIFSKDGIKFAVATAKDATGFTEAMRINSSGNIGVGATNPIAKLYVNNATVSQEVFRADGVSGGAMIVGINGTTWANSTLSLMGQNLYITSTNVGIGMTSPGVKLDVNGSIRSNTTIFTPSLTNNTSGYGLQVGGSYATQLAMSSNTGANFEMMHNTLIERNASDASVYKWVNSHPSFGSRGIRFSYGGAGSGITFFADSAVTTAGTAFTPTQRMIIQNDGNVGIAKASPGTTLDVVGSINASGTVNGTGLCIGGDCKVSWPAVGSASSGWNRTAPYIYPATLTDSVGIGVTNPSIGLHVEKNNGNGWAALFRSSSSNAGLLIGSLSANYITLAGIDSTLGIYKDIALNPSGGNVGIGTTAPGQRLEIAGASGVALSIKTNSAVSGDTTQINLGANASIPQGGVILKSIRTSDSGANTDFTIAPTLNGGQVEALRVLSTGNVGIGTTTPNAKLHVNGTGAISSEDSIKIQSSIYPILSFYSDNANTSNRNWKIASVYSAYGKMEFLHSSSAGTAPTVNLLTLDGLNDRIGIVKTNPGTTLDITGGVNASGTVNGTGLCIAGVCKTDWGGVGATSGWTANGTAVYKTDTTGNVGIGTTNPTAAKLTVSGDISATGASLSGALVMNPGGTKQNITGVNKLTVDVIDPLYYINGINYSSYAASMVGGVKEEYVGKIKLEKKNRTVQEFEATLDFSGAAEGSELWLWRKVVDFNKDNVEVLITPYGRFARTYYFIDGERLVFRSDLPVEISYRLIGRRFDWRKWPTRATDQTERGMDVK